MKSLRRLKEELKAINKMAIHALDWQIKSQSIIKELLLLNSIESEFDQPLTKLRLLDKMASNHWDFDCVFKKQSALEYLNQRFTTYIRT